MFREMKIFLKIDDLNPFDILFIIFLALVILSIIFVKISNHFSILEDDCYIEERIEEIVEKETGMKIDITPVSQE